MPAPKQATVILTATPELVAPGGSTQLAWSAPDADVCTASGTWSGERAAGGRETSPPITGPSEFRLRCVGPAGAAERTLRVGVEAPLRVTDRYGRELGGTRELVLVDWEGYMTNPAIEFFLEPRPDTALPGTVTLNANHPRLYLDNKHDAARSIEVSSHAPVRARLSNFTDADTDDGEHTLSIRFEDANGEVTETKLRVREIDHDWTVRMRSRRLLISVRTRNSSSTANTSAR